MTGYLADICNPSCLGGSKFKASPGKKANQQARDGGTNLSSQLQGGIKRKITDRLALVNT
jgi:hypothetical protein